MHAAFLYHAVKAGLDMGLSMLVSWPFMRKSPDLLNKWKTSLLNRRPDATERLVQFAQTVKGEKKPRRKKLNGVREVWRSVWLMV